ncbi:MAG: hypothetical protein JF887_07435 [Candidatus Dormibacteraeota bacterium]|uniref:Uncharacterized protein n=1 Tax=Candidatus Amunia macphersoniae TaxID=3127014 RepID=A0A934KNI0_9BACT|nr:hypothetical protein [Candidatus Dormibacteraeota bacterium]
MPLLSSRVLVPVALVVVAWGAAHLLASHDVAVTPSVWPVPTASSAPASSGAMTGPGLLHPSPASTPTPESAGTVPILPGALEQLNGNTRDTAVGLYGVIQELEGALRDHLQQLIHQLEPGR